MPLLMLTFLPVSKGFVKGNFRRVASTLLCKLLEGFLLPGAV